MLRTLLLLALLSTAALTAVAQYESDYTPLGKTSARSKALIDELANPELPEIQNIRSLNTRIKLTEPYDRIVRSLITKVKKGYFIDDDSTQHYVNFIFNTIIQKNNLPKRPRRLLISRDMIANAVCYGEGTFVVTLGLLSKSENESQIAFSLAHELAHYELNHVFKRIEREVNNSTSKSINKKTVNILLNDRATSQDLEDLKAIVYSETRFSRQFESQADSLALVYLSHTPYHVDEGQRELALLDSALYPKYELGDQWFSAFQFTKYPFQEYWLKPKLSIYNNKQENLFIYSADSLHSHPEMQTRIAELRSYSFTDNHPVNFQSDSLVKAMSLQADFESMETAYIQKQYDFCLYYGLQLLSLYPKNSYLVTRISSILLRLYEAVDFKSTSNYVQGYTAYYPAQLKQVNAFLSNLNKEELGELAYHFINKKPHFNAEVKLHYYLLWLACKNTGRADVQAKIEKAYEEKFNKQFDTHLELFNEAPPDNRFNPFMR